MASAPDRPPSEIRERIALDFLCEYLDARARGCDPSAMSWNTRFAEHGSTVRAEHDRLRRPPELPRAVGPYRILRDLSRGGQGAVFLAEDTRLGRRVALKLLHRPSPQARSRMRREAALLARLDHPGIAVVLDADFDRSLPFVVMRYVEGWSLAELLAADAPRTPVAPRLLAPEPAGRARLVEFFEHAAKALDAAHRAGVVHRDVKPANLMVDRRGRPVLVDFGLAAGTDDSVVLTRTGGMLGTPAYMSPQQLEHSGPRRDPRDDVWSLGAVLYEALTGRRPFEAPTHAQLVRAITSCEPTDPARLAPAVPRALADVVLQALEKDPARRYASARALADDLRRARSTERVAARRPGALGRTVRWARRNPLLAGSVGMAFGCLLLGLVTTWMLWRRAEGEARAKARAYDELAQLADVERLRQLVQWELELWPATPERLGGPRGMDAWLREAQRLLSRGPGHRRARQELRARIARTSVDPTTRWRATLLDEVVGALDDLPRRMASVWRRRARAAWLERETVERADSKWRETLAAIRASPRYRGLRLRPQFGLVPIGFDPDTGLAEFAHPATGTIPRRDARGRLRREEHTGLVFVLVPGGSFTMGSPARLESRDPPRSPPDEQPAHTVSLGAFLISKYEMTGWQWRELAGSNTSMRAASHARTDHPVERISWHTTVHYLQRAGLDLPTEAQWEYAARGGGSRSWWGADASELARFANLADRTFARAVDPRLRVPHCAEADDGFADLAPVGSLAPNPFGLHDVLGNVAEWCRDAFVRYSRPPKGAEGLRRAGRRGSSRIVRGGHAASMPARVRVAARDVLSPGVASPFVGVRPIFPWAR